MITRNESGVMVIKKGRAFKQTMQAHGMVSLSDADIYNPEFVKSLKDLFPKGIEVPRFLRGAKIIRVKRVVTVMEDA